MFYLYCRHRDVASWGEPIETEDHTLTWFAFEIMNICALFRAREPELEFCWRRA